MASHDLVGAIRAIHVFSGVLWLGLIWAMAWVVVPLSVKLQPGTRMDLMPKLGRRMITFIAASAGSTLLFGFILFVLRGPGNVGMGIHLGMTLAIVMFLIAVILVIPAQKRMIGMMEGGSPPAPKDLGRVMRWATVNAWLGVATLLVMVLGTHGPLLV